MEAIATLTRNDPYLTLPRKARVAARRERRSRLFAVPQPIMSVAVEVITEIEPEPTPEQTWIERQKKIPIPKEPWFCIVDEIEPSEPRRPTIREIQQAVAAHFNVTRADLLCARRTAAIVRPRQVGYYLSKVLTLRSLPEIGRMFGGRDHTSALSGIRKIERLRKEDAQLEADLQAVATALAGSL